MSRGTRPEFSDSQVWCKTSGKKLKFLDQSLEVARCYEEDDDDDEEPIPIVRHPATRGVDSSSGHLPDSAPDPTKALKTAIWGIDSLAVRSVDDEATSSSAAGFSRPADTPRLTFDTPQRSDLLAMTTPPSLRHNLSEQSHDDHHAYSFASRSTLSPYSILQYGASPRLEVSSAPLNERGKADLFRYYVRNIGPAFDSYDPNKYFTERIPSQATLSSPLLELILAVSAWHSNATRKEPQRSANLDVNLEQLALAGMDDDTLDVALLLHHFILNMDGKEFLNVHASIIIMPRANPIRPTTYNCFSYFQKFQMLSNHFHPSQAPPQIPPLPSLPPQSLKCPLFHPGLSKHLTMMSCGRG